MLIRSFRFILAFIVFLLLFTGLTVIHADACTIWGAAGEKAVNGGTILAKNHDWMPEGNEIRIVVPKSGFIYVGLFPVKGSNIRGAVAGINEKGLAIVTASVTGMPKSTRDAGEKDLNEKILTLYDSVDALLKSREIFPKNRPSFYLIADRTKIALIEVSPHGEMAIKTTESGILYHTNHYIDESMARINKKFDISSEMRLGRIAHLLTSYQLPFAIDDFIVFSEDRNEGPDNSIWRTGSTPKKERTLVSWIVCMPKEGFPELYVKLVNPDEPETTYNFILDKAFWTEGIE